MDINDRPNAGSESSSGAEGVSRRAILLTAAAAGTLAAAPDVLADTAPQTSFGAPLVELYVPAGVLSLEQRAAMIKGVTDVVFGAMKQQPDAAHRMFVTIIESAEGGFGVDGQVFVPRK